MTADDGRAEWAARWKAAAPRLEAIRIAELQTVDTIAFIESMNGGFEAVRLSMPPATTSGLVEQQRLFSTFRE